MHDPFQIRVSMLCDRCRHETVLCEVTLDPMDVSSLARAEAEIDREIGSGVIAACPSCEGACNTIRIYWNNQLQEEMGAEEFVAKYQKLGEEDRPNAG